MKGVSSYLGSADTQHCRLTAEELREGHLADLVALHLDPDAVHVPDIRKARKRLTPGPH